MLVGMSERLVSLRLRHLAGLSSTRHERWKHCVQAAALLGELRSTWGMRPPAAEDGCAAITKYVYSSNATVR